MNNSIISASHLFKTYPDGQVHALNDVSLDVRPGEFAAIVGPSGSGKSTLLNVLGALDRPDSGEVRFEGNLLKSTRELDRFRAQKIGFVFQSFFLLPTLTSRENVQVPMFGGELSSRARARRADELLELVGMSHRRHHRPGKLSVGERQRVALARSLANGPALLLADEPTGNLDSENAERVMGLLTRLQRDHSLALVMVTHSDEIACRADRIIKMRDGRIIDTISSRTA